MNNPLCGGSGQKHHVQNKIVIIPSLPQQTRKIQKSNALGVLYFEFLALHKGFVGFFFVNLGYAKREVARTLVINVRLIMVDRMCKRAERS